MSFSPGSGTPMIPVEEGKYLLRRAVESRSRLGADFAAGGDAGFAGGAVGIAGVDGDDLDSAVRLQEILAADDDGRGDDSVAGEHGRGGGAFVRDGDGEVGFAAGLETGFYGGELESGWKEEIGKMRG